MKMGGDGHGVTYKGVTIHQPKRWHSVTGKGMCAMMWYDLSFLFSLLFVLMYSIDLRFALLYDFVDSVVDIMI